MDILIHIFSWSCYFSFTNSIFSSEIAKAQGRYMFNLLRNSQTPFQNLCTILYSHLRCMKSSDCSTSQHSLLSVLLILLTLVNAKLYLLMVLIWIFLLIKDVEHIFIVYWLIVYLPFQVSVQILCPYTDQIFHIFVVDLQEFLIYSCQESFVGFVYCDYILSPVCVCGVFLCFDKQKNLIL